MAVCSLGSALVNFWWRKAEFDKDHGDKGRLTIPFLWSFHLSKYIVSFAQSCSQEGKEWHLTGQLLLWSSTGVNAKGTVLKIVTFILWEKLTNNNLLIKVIFVVKKYLDIYILWRRKEFGEIFFFFLYLTLVTIK